MTRWRLATIQVLGSKGIGWLRHSATSWWVVIHKWGPFKWQTFLRAGKRRRSRDLDRWPRRGILQDLLRTYQRQGMPQYGFCSTCALSKTRDAQLTGQAFEWVRCVIPLAASKVKLSQRFESRLENVPFGDDGRVFCETTPVSFLGHHFPGPHVCTIWVGGMVCTWVILCWLVFSEENWELGDLVRWRRAMQVISFMISGLATSTPSPFWSTSLLLKIIFAQSWHPSQ